jgi:hypothetical protein
MIQRILLASILCLCLLPGKSFPVQAMPPLPSSFYGTLTVNGSHVPAGLPVSAWINGVQYALSSSLLSETGSFYAISIPGDDPATPQIEGGVANDLITFKIENLVADQTGLWQSGSNLALNLTATGSTLNISSEHGSVQKNPAMTYYLPGEEVTITAMPDPGWNFTGWSGDLVSSQNPATLSILQNTSLTANYESTGFWIFLPLITH